MENYVVMENRPASEMLDLSALSACKLNDFEAFDNILFGENVQPDYSKFYLGNLKMVDYDCEYTIALPFLEPTTMVEHQINHYVMWGVIGMLKINVKPTYFIEYNTGIYMSDFRNTCWACEYGTKCRGHMCEHCPIWYSNGHFVYMCESGSSLERQGKHNDEDLNAYRQWDRNDNTEEEFEELAIELQMYPWHVTQYNDVSGN